MVKDMVKANVLGEMELLMKVNGEMEKSMDMENLENLMLELHKTKTSEPRLRTS